MERVCGCHKCSYPARLELFGVAGQPRHGDGAHAGHMRRGCLAHAARTRHPSADAPVLETAAQRSCASGGF